MKMRTKLAMSILVASLVILMMLFAGCSQPGSASNPPVVVISVSGPISPFNPGGPMVLISLENVSDQPIVSVMASLEINRSFDFNFDVSAASPWLPGNTISAQTTLINGGFSDDQAYPLKISGTLKNGTTFNVTDQVMITAPSAASPGTIAPASSSISASPNSVSAKSANDLSLALSIDSTSYHPGDKILVTISETNTLSAENKVPAGDKWPVQGLQVGACGVLNYPFGFCILQGNYEIKDITSRQPLKLYDPAAPYACPLILGDITAYGFQPSSDKAAIYAADNATTESINMAVSAEYSGFWTGSPQASFGNFTPGIYTVVGGDEWGTVAILHFTIA